MSKQNWVVAVGIVVWVLAASYFGVAYGDSTQATKARELIEQDRREALQALLAQNPELKALIEQIRKQVR